MTGRAKHLQVGAPASATHGAALPDPTGLFNAGFGGATRRAIDIRQGETVDATAFKVLIRVAVTLNVAKQKAVALR